MADTSNLFLTAAIASSNQLVRTQMERTYQMAKWQDSGTIVSDGSRIVQKANDEIQVDDIKPG